LTTHLMHKLYPVFPKNSTTENDRKISKASSFVNDKLKNNLTIEIMWFIIKITPHKLREMLHKGNTA
ncbi:hypothetical protein, partial [Ruminococcus callidus]|uniref:hypothetical protein n=1 Tax=Ruminococcus callidus TaxID=40519 RepID=UPI003FD8F2C0